MSTQKTIRLYETFESYDEFKTTIDAYCQLTHQALTVVDSKKLKPKDSSQASEDLKGRSLQMRVVENALNTTFFDHILTL